ncbi:MAG: hypothetical protein U0822_05285 [Anaerolineae bacterium]
MGLQTSLKHTSRSPVSSPVVGLPELHVHLEEGWAIDGPVYRTEDRKRGRVIFHFITWYGRTPRVVSVADAPEVQRFLAEQMLEVEES